MMTAKELLERNGIRLKHSLNQGGLPWLKKLQRSPNSKSFRMRS